MPMTSMFIDWALTREWDMAVKVKLWVITPSGLGGAESASRISVSCEQAGAFVYFYYPAAGFPGID